MPAIVPGSFDRMTSDTDSADHMVASPMIARRMIASHATARVIKLSLSPA
jgi:hypothetical protein